MLNKQQQADLDGFRDAAIEMAVEMHPELPISTCIDLVAIGMATISSFLREHPVASMESVREYMDTKQ